MFNGTSGITSPVVPFNASTVTSPNNQTLINGTLVSSGGSINSTVANITKKIDGQQYTTLGERIANSISELWGDVRLKFDLLWNGPKPKTSMQMIVADVHKKQLRALENDIYSALKKAASWNDRTTNHIVESSVKYLESDLSGDPIKAAEWVNLVLKANLPKEEFEQVIQAIEKTLLEGVIDAALLQLAVNQWNEVSVNDAARKIAEHLKSNIFRNDKEARQWFDTTYKEKLTGQDYRRITIALDKALKVGSEKRRVTSTKRETYSFTLSEKMAIDPSNTTWDRLNVCGSGSDMAFFGATNTSQVVQLYSLRNNTLSRMIESDGINALTPARRGRNNISSFCKAATFDIITTNNQTVPGPMYYHTRIKDGTLEIPQYSPPDQINDLPAYAPRPAYFGNRTVLAYSVSDYVLDHRMDYFYATDETGRFGNSTFFPEVFSRPAWTANRIFYETIGFNDGSGFVLGYFGLGDDLFTSSFYPNLTAKGVPLQTPMNSEILNKTVNVPFGPQNPLPDQIKHVGFINQLNNGSTVYNTYDRSTNAFTSSHVLPDAPNELVADATMNIAYCPQPQEPTAHAYVREVKDSLGKRIFKFDLVDTNGDSLLGGEQTFTNVTLGSAFPQPGVACLEGRIVFGFLDGDKPVCVELRFDAAPSIVPTTAPTTPVIPPSPVASPSSEQTFTPDGSLIFIIRLPDGTATGTFTGDQIFVYDPSIATVNLINLNGWIVTDSNGIEVKPGTYPIGQALSFTYNNQNAAPNSVFNAEGCTDQGRCNTLTLQNIFDPGNDNVKIIVPIIAGGAGLAALVVFLIKKLWYDKLQKERIEKYGKNRIVTTEEKI